MPVVKIWTDEIHYAGAVVAHLGGTWQAHRDTGKEPGASADWTPLAKPGKDGASPQVRGLWQDGQDYRELDIVALNGGSFIAKRDRPGPCPGDGWQLLASQGKQGKVGEPGGKGAKGEPGASGPRGDRGLDLVSWQLDRTNYTATPIMADGRKGPPLELRGLFEQFQIETA